MVWQRIVGTSVLVVLMALPVQAQHGRNNPHPSAHPTTPARTAPAHQVQGHAVPVRRPAPPVQRIDQRHIIPFRHPPVFFPGRPFVTFGNRWDLWAGPAVFASTWDDNFYTYSPFERGMGAIVFIDTPDEDGAVWVDGVYVGTYTEVLVNHPLCLHPGGHFIKIIFTHDVPTWSWYVDIHSDYVIPFRGRWRGL